MGTDEQRFKLTRENISQSFCTSNESKPRLKCPQKGLGKASGELETVSSLTKVGRKVLKVSCDPHKPYHIIRTEINMYNDKSIS